ncbi:hypothetical protein ACOI22_11305 [Glaciecola sp. 2405UD65-10]|uniref:hypothetical protein n=1 Tax=Glaciecola sp. 2405UD65-10 TaxID=3397244 RepID=UPI003B5A97FA
MNVFKTLRRRYVVWQYKKHKRNIIEGISITEFTAIIDQYHDQGWEVFSYTSLQLDGNTAWSGKLRKGSISLLCNWSLTNEGSIIGPARVMKGVGAELNMPIQTHPHFN